MANGRPHIVDDKGFLQNSIIGQTAQYIDNVNLLVNRVIGKNLYVRSIIFKDTTLIRNPYKMRYDKDSAHVDPSSPNIGERYKIYGRAGRQIAFLDDVGGLSGYTWGGGDEYFKEENTELKANIAASKEYRPTEVDFAEISENAPKSKYDKTNSYDKNIDNLNNGASENGTLTFFQITSGSVGGIIAKSYDVVNKISKKTQNKYGDWGRTTLKQYESYTADTRAKLLKGDTIEGFQNSLNIPNYRPFNGTKRLSDMSVLNKNGTINFTPYKNGDGNLNKESIKRCMFSIENLAWKDIARDKKINSFNGNVLSNEQQGPNGGRVMWFPPYNLKFNENISTNWDSNSFIGRGEKIYTYIDTEKSGTLSFSLLIDHPASVSKYAANKPATEEIDNDIISYFKGEGILNNDNGSTRETTTNLKFSTQKPKDKKIIENNNKYFIVYYPFNYSGGESDTLDYLSKHYESEETKESQRHDANLPTFTYTTNNELNKSAITSDDLKRLGLGYISSKDVYPFTDIFAINSRRKFIEYITGNESSAIKDTDITVKAYVSGYYSCYESGMTGDRKNDIAKFLRESGIADIVYEGGDTDMKADEPTSYTVSLKENKIKSCAFVQLVINSNVKKVDNIKQDSKNASSYTYTAITNTVNSDMYNVDNEYLYFKNMAEKESFIQNITRKVQFFTPAFHSITPEGFNERLTFLNQCTRQGPTLNNNKVNNAGNLAFGRPPFCVLRIGDFYNTKILIDSISIDYDNGGITWDLNQDGAGVQPMIANITLGIKFLGGSDISGPIDKIQNAISSNFYANTSIFDPRADYRKQFKDMSNDDKNEVYEFFMDADNDAYHMTKNEKITLDTAINNGTIYSKVPLTENETIANNSIPSISSEEKGEIYEQTANTPQYKEVGPQLDNLRVVKSEYKDTIAN